MGTGGFSPSDTPIAVVGGHTFTSLTAGATHNCALESGAALCWGDGVNGTIGNGGTSDVNTRTPVSGGLHFSSLDAGDRFTCGVATTGFDYCWGRNAESELGNASTSNASTPVNLFMSSASATASVTVDPALTFTISGRSGICNGQSATNFQSGSTASTVNLGHVTSGSTAGGAQDLSVSSNAGGGSGVFIRTPGSTPNALRDVNGHFVSDVAGTNATPGAAPNAGTPGFGYSTSGAGTAFSSNKWAQLTNVDSYILSASAGTSSGSACVGYQVAVGSTTPAGNYAATVIYTVVPTF